VLVGSFALRAVIIVVIVPTVAVTMSRRESAVGVAVSALVEHQRQSLIGKRSETKKKKKSNKGGKERKRNMRDVHRNADGSHNDHDFPIDIRRVLSSKKAGKKKKKTSPP